MVKKSTHKKHFFNKIPEIEDIEKAMIELVKTQADIYLWEKGKENVEAYQARNYRPDTRSLEIEISGNFLSRLSGSSLVNRAVLFKAGEGQYLYFGEGTFTRDPVTKDYLLGWAPPLYQSRQRTNYRIKADSENILKIKIQNTLYSCYDLSAGGVSFEAPAYAQETFAKGRTFPYCTVYYNNAEFTVATIEIVSLNFLKGPDGEILNCKPGVAFREISKDTEQALVKYINSQARYQEIKKSLHKK